MAQQKSFELIHMPWWGWLLMLALFETCAILAFVGLFTWGVPLPS
ncbi:MAG TPA: hypothetical protein VGC53_10620 [Vicinamibacteria bacterium]|jgi:hypothetical protein